VTPDSFGLPFWFKEEMAMGEVIRKGAAVEDIFADVRTAMHNGTAKGGKMKTVVEEEIGPMAVMIDTIEVDLTDATKAAGPKIAAIKAENERADDLLARIYDDLWNDLGRPGHDRALSLIFPGGRWVLRRRGHRRAAGSDGALGAVA
jgi:hypothetical protein